jgi:aminoglycoside phosphotransferase (APT) family kinase protein
MYVFSVTYSLKNCEFRKEFVLRTCRDNNEERMMKEYKALKALKAQGLPVPTAIELELQKDIIGAPFMIMEKINGASASNFLGDEKNALAIVDMLAKLLASLHKVDARILFRTDLSENKLEQSVKFRESMLSELKEVINIGYITSFSPFVRRKYLQALMKLEKCKMQGFNLALIHADFGPDHVLLSECGPVITDLEGIRLGDPAYDVGWVYHAIKLEGRIMIDHRFVKASKQMKYDFDLGEKFVECYKKYYGSIPVNLEFYKNLNALKLLARLDLHVRPGYASVSRIFRLRPQEILSQTIGAYGTIRSFKRYCEFFLQSRNIL